MKQTRTAHIPRWATSLLFAGSFACSAGALAQVSAQCTSGSARFLASGAEVIDSRAGLVWQRCPVGQSWQSNNSCSGSATLMNHEVALAYARVNAGSQGWRLPSVKEVFGSLLERECTPVPINTDLFPGSGSQSIWTGTPVVATPNVVFVAGLGAGDAGGAPRGAGVAVYLVRRAP